MQWKRFAILAALLVLAGVFGWLLPGVVFRLSDRAEENVAQPVQIGSFDLSFRSDLSLADRLQLVNGADESAEPIRLENGMYRKADEVCSLADAFLTDFADGAQTLTPVTWKAEPMLLRFEDVGAFVVWVAETESENGWELAMLLDDQTGAVLAIELYGGDGLFDSLFPDLGASGEGTLPVIERLESALAAQYGVQLSEQLGARVFRDLPQGTADDYESGDIVLYGETEIYRMPYLLVLSAGYLRLNQD